MKVKVLVASLSMLAACSAFASSQVTLYGVLDLGVGVTKDKGQSTKVKMENGKYQGNRWGIKGAEDLGNGNSVVFQLESGFKASNGEAAQNKGTFSRQSTLGLQGNWGELHFGRVGALSSDCGPFSIIGGSPLVTIGYAKGNMNGAFVFTDRYNNIIVYRSPVMDGFRLSASYSNGLDTDTDKWSDNAHYYGIGGTYAKGGLNLDVIAEYIDNKDVKTSDDENVKGTKLFNVGGSYNFGSFKLYAAYQYVMNSQYTAGNISVQSLLGARTVKGANQNAFTIGASAPAFGGTLMGQVNYAFGKFKDSGLDQEKYNALSFGGLYTYPLSKRTLVYGFAGYSQTGKALKRDSAGDLRGWATTVGLRHAF